MGAMDSNVAAREVRSRDGDVVDHQPPAKPHQNPAFPAAFVFQSNSALFLATDVNAPSMRIATPPID